MWQFNRRDFLAASAGLALGGLSFGADKPKKLVLLAGKPSHGPGDHEFNAGTWLLKECLAKTPNLEVVIHKNGWPEDVKAFDGASGVLIYSDGGGGHPFVQEKRLEVIGKLVASGVGLMAAHYGVEVPKDKAGKEFQEWIGGYYEHEWSVNPMWVPEFKTFPDHPITRGVKPFKIRDEWYFNMRFRPEMKGITPILSATPSDATRDGPYVYPKGPYKHIQEAKGRSESMMWCVEPEKAGRGVGFTGGHIHKNWQDDNFRKVVLNALLWICKIDVPKDGVESKVDDEMIAKNLDPKGKK